MFLGFALRLIGLDALAGDALGEPRHIPINLMHDLRGMGETNAMETRLRHPTRRAVMTRAAQIYATRFGTTDRRIRATFEVITLTGWAPAPTQPQPLRPGSATHRLAAALHVTETPVDPSGD